MNRIIDVPIHADGRRRVIGEVLVRGVEAPGRVAVGTRTPVGVRVEDAGGVRHTGMPRPVDGGSMLLVLAAPLLAFAVAAAIRRRRRQ
ncbi:MAG TPA: hypothetical protein VNM91_05280 [Dehalococcoidia bacterium]|nr:hypothetical protein [Dehalococcoidia bacterium]